MKNQLDEQLAKDVPGFTFTGCRFLLSPEYPEIFSCGECGRQEIRNASIMSHNDYSNLVRAAYPWWKFWRKKERKRLRFGPGFDKPQTGPRIQHPWAPEK